jgi:hypothetical protein
MSYFSVTYAVSYVTAQIPFLRSLILCQWEIACKNKRIVGGRYSFTPPSKPSAFHAFLKRGLR